MTIPAPVQTGTARDIEASGASDIADFLNSRMNGVFVNGQSVEWSRLVDGDEIGIGRYHLHVIDTVGSPAGAGNPSPALNG